MKRYGAIAVVVTLASSAAACDVFVDRRTVANETVTSVNMQRLRSVLLEYRRDRDTSESTSIDLMSAAARRPVGGYSYAYSPDGPIAATSPLFRHFEIHASPTRRRVNGNVSFWASDASEVRPYLNGAPGLGHR